MAPTCTRRATWAWSRLTLPCRHVWRSFALPCGSSPATCNRCLATASARFLPPAIVRLTLRIFELLLVSALIELAMSLPMAIYFHRVTALGLPVNLLVVPLIGLALPSALITFATLLISPSLAIAPAAVTAALLHAISGIVRLFGEMGAGDIRISTPGSIAIVAGILLIGLAVWAARNSRFPVVGPIAALACSAACVFYPRALAYHPGALEVTAIDVGQGDSLLLVSPQGKTLLVDAGGPIGGAQASNSNFEIGEDVVSPCCGAAISAVSMRSPSPTRTAITWVECFLCCRTFAPGSSG